MASKPTTGNDSEIAEGAGKSHTPTNELVSYLTLRRVIGILGILLPVLLGFGCVLLDGCDGILDSISAYYGSGVRDILVGILFTVGWFLFSYKGYERADDRAGDLGCIFALGVALFPVTSQSWLIRTVHYVSASALFLVLTYFSICLFTKTGDTPTPKKKARNKVYVTCGVIMLICIVLIPLHKIFWAGSALAAFRPVFWLESLALWAFGISWMTKGEMLLTDSKGDDR